MIYPVVVVSVAVGILTFIMLKIVPAFAEMFAEFEPRAAQDDHATDQHLELDRSLDWYLIPLFPFTIWLSSSCCASSRPAAWAGTCSCLKFPIFGSLVEKNTMARTTRTLGTLVASGVPILEGPVITNETAGNAMFERMYGKITEAIREGETIAKPMREHSKPPLPLAGHAHLGLHRLRPASSSPWPWPS